MNEQERLQRIIDILADEACEMCECSGDFDDNIECSVCDREVQRVAKEITAIFKQPQKDTRSRRERKLDEQFAAMGVKPRVYHFTKRAILRGAFKAITVVQVEVRGQEGRGGHIQGYDAISTCIEKNTRLKIIEQATHLIESFEKIGIYGIAICDRRDVFSKRYGRMKAKGGVMQHVLKEVQEK